MEGLRFCLAPRGKPFLEGSPLEFNFSHTEGLLACCFSREAVGIDIERLDPLQWPSHRWEPLVARFFTQDESQFLHSQPIQKQFLTFFKIFTLKEAYSKNLGLGLGLDFTLIPLPLPLKMKSSHKGYDFFVRRWNKNYCLALVVKNPGKRLWNYGLHPWTDQTLERALNRQSPKVKVEVY
jgi:4'-phosphopantetheinyl transferase